jgi:polar amino acid transport system substrate-binding protein
VAAESARWASVFVPVLLIASCTGGDPQPDEAAVASERDDTRDAVDDVPETDPDEYTLVEDGVLNVCADVPLPPFSFEDPETPTGYGGFDLDMVAAVADGLALELAVVDVTFEAITTGAAFSEARCDLAASALLVSDEWARHLDFTAPYYEVKQSLIVLEGAEATELSEMAGQRIGVQAGMPAEAFLRRELPTEAEMVAFDNTTDLLAGLDIGDVDAVLLNLPTSTEWIAADVGVRVVETLVTDDAYAFAVARDRSDALQRLVDTEIDRLRDDGTRDRLLALHFALPLDDDATGDAGTG